MNIKVSFQNKALSSRGGLYFFEKLCGDVGLESLVEGSLPQPRISTQVSPYDKFKALTFGLLVGADTDLLCFDPAFCAFNPNLVGSTSYGDFLRKFSGIQLQKLNQSLTRCAPGSMPTSALSLTSTPLPTFSTVGR